MNFLAEKSPTAEPNNGGARTQLAIYRDRILLATLGIVIGLDQLTKFLVRENLALRESVPADGFFRLTHHTNTGTIFGLFPSATVVLTVVSVLAIGFLVYFYRSQRTLSPLMRLAIGLLLGGAFGNLIDRVVSGGVTDFIDVGRWPIFNIADASITVGIFMLIVFTSLVPNKNSSRGEEDAGRSDGEPGRERDGSLVSKPGDRAG